MKILTLTVEYAVTRSRDYQSVRLGASAELALTDAEAGTHGTWVAPAEVFARAQSWMARRVNAAAAQELDILTGYAPENQIEYADQ